MAGWSSQLWWRCASGSTFLSRGSSLLLLLLLTLLAAGGHTQNLSLEFSSENFSTYADSFLCLGACEIGSEQVTLPSSGGGDGVGIGRLLYRTPVQFFNASAGLFASFRTSFVFTISGASPDAPIADGLVFFITPRVSIPLRSGGGGLGLFEPRHDPPYAGQPVFGSTSVVAVEIDTFCGASNTWDPGYAPHVGLDVDSLNSVALSKVLPEISIGSTVGVWIQYSAVTRELGVRVHVVRSPAAPSEGNAHSVLNYTGFDLSQFVKEESYIGFSATQGLYVQTNNISYWNFELTLPGAAEAPALASPVLPLASPSYLPTTLSRSGSGSNNARSSVLIVVGLPVALVTLALGFCLCLTWRGKYRERPLWPLSSIPALELSEHPQLPPAAGYGPGQISYNMLDRATDGFSTILGRGGFGRVYRGVLQDGSQVAVKRIKAWSKDGFKQVAAEVTRFARLSHKNLVPLRGWSQGHQELLLVYDYMPNGSLDSRLYPDDTSNCCITGALDWETRVKIIRAVADALNHLHQGREQPLVHGNIKPTSVLLDASFTARLGDFGLLVARSEDNAGTVGYFAPECEDSFKLEPSSDIFSFGVVVLEVLSGRKALDWSKPHNESDLVTWIWSLYIMGSLMDALDPQITAESYRAEAMMLLQLGLMCCFPDPSSRPTVHVISQFLTKSVHLPDLPKEVPPAFCHAPATTLARKYVALMKALNSSSSLMRSRRTSMSSLEPAEFISGCSVSSGHRLCD